MDPPSLHAKGLSPAIDAIVLRGLARDRAQRYATAREMALAIEAAIPLAPPSQVGRWVESLVGEALADRTQQIAGIERLVDGSGDMTSSALMTIGAGAQPAIEQDDPPVPSARAATLSRTDRTAPTDALGAVPARMADPTVVDRVVDRRAATPPGAREASPMAPGRSSRRTGSTVALLLLPLAAYVGTKALAARGATAVPARAAAVSPIETRPAAPEPPPSQTQSSDWLPVPVSQPETAPAGGAPIVAAVAPLTGGAAGAKKGSPNPVPSARPMAPRGQAAPQPTVVAEAPVATSTATAPRAPTPAPNVSSCDPPFYIDADGTKRYKRYCANL